MLAEQHRNGIGLLACRAARYPHAELILLAFSLEELRDDFSFQRLEGLDALEAELKETVGAVEGVSLVKVKIEWNHEWSRNDITPEARIIARDHGYCI